MATDPSWPSEPAGRYSLSTLLAPAALMRLGVIALVLLGVASAFAWTAQGGFRPAAWTRSA